MSHDNPPQTWSATLREWGARQVYWRAPSMLDRLTGRSDRKAIARVRVEMSPFAEQLRATLALDGRPCLVHSALGSLDWVDAQGNAVAGLSAAAWLLHQLLEIVGASGTLCMPTHPKYAENPGFMFDKSALRLTYDVRRTPSSVGLLTELFRRRPAVKRSHHPLSPMAVLGPLAGELLAGNLEGAGEVSSNPTGAGPLPHGKSSSYYRFCQADGLVVGIGLSLIKALTVIHVAEEVRDGDWPVAGFFYPRCFDVIDEQGSRQTVAVRERRPEFVRSLILGRVRADLLREGILREDRLAGVAVSTADARGVLQFMQDRQRTSTYPYLWPRIAGWGKPRKAKAAL